jgi:hypothetical protein
MITQSGTSKFENAKPQFVSLVGHIFGLQIRPIEVINQKANLQPTRQKLKHIE